MPKELEELQESEVIYPDNDRLRHYHHQLDDDTCVDDQEMAHQKTRVLRKNTSKINRNFEKRIASSLPVNIPESIYRHAINDDLEEGPDDGKMVPPHVIIDRRLIRKMSSVFMTGNLKGRNLSKVRNSVLRMTGFLET
ncbi:hypothetical protein CJ030_MR2G007590 [Morella rubra]|uniref:Uncharacterized protein n=1 Tax=Morella rubra TaxID=262757 RepID=A0A6A1WBW7_9ROSI|nr:hypothetical protein CJ030_MR2G007590 [Morella rubra]